MDDSFFAYLEQLELMAFFSGYPLVYALTFFITGNQQSRIGIKGKIVSLLPFAYALVGTLYLGLQLKKLYPDYSFEHIELTMQRPYLLAWGLLSLLFWIPALAKRPVLSLIHSLVFFFFLVRDLIVQSSASSADNNIVRNDMKIYTDSLLLNLGAFALIILLFILFTYFKKKQRSSIRK